jgi:hypothetical protein
MCCQSWKFKIAAIFMMASKMFIFFTQYFQKWYFCKFFFCLFTLGKNITLMNFFFLENSKWRNNMNFFKKLQDFIIAQPQNEMFSIFDMLWFWCYNKIKSMLPSQKIKMAAYYVKKVFVVILIFKLRNIVFIVSIRRSNYKHDFWFLKNLLHPFLEVQLYVEYVEVILKLSFAKEILFRKWVIVKFYRFFSFKDGCI